MNQWDVDRQKNKISDIEVEIIRKASRGLSVAMLMHSMKVETNRFLLLTAPTDWELLERGLKHRVSPNKGNVNNFNSGGLTQ